MVWAGATPKSSRTRQVDIQAIHMPAQQGFSLADHEAFVLLIINVFSTGRDQARDMDSTKSR
jgi:hypothetical protein